MSWREHFQVNIDENEMYDEHNYFNNEESIFETDTVFSSRDELLDWVRKTGYSVGYVVVIKTSKSNESVTIQCDRSGISISKKKSTKNTGSKKCGCPFELVFSSRNELLDWVRKTGYSVGYVVVIKTSKSNESVTIQCDRSEEAYARNLEQLTETVVDSPGVITYLNTHWLARHKELFVVAWTKEYLHFGNHTTSRVESQHAKLKLYLDSSQSDLERVVSYIHEVVNSQVTGIKASIQESRMVMRHRYDIPHFQNLNRFISLYALDIIFHEFQKCGDVEIYENCRCQLRTSYGLPCSHEQAMYLFNGQPLPLDVVDAFWKKLDFSPCISLGDNQDCEAELEKLNAEFNKQFGLPSTTSVRDPPAKKTTRGRPSRRKTHVEPPKPSNSSLPKQARHAYINQFPRMFHAFIDRVQDVKADGNCGFRATAVGLGLHEDEWPTIRYRLLQELGMHSQQYVSMFGVDGYNHVRDRLNFFNIDECAPMIKWMSMPEIGILIASHFNVILHTITNLGSQTYLPLRSSPPPRCQHNFISLGFVNNGHYVSIFLNEGYPVPTVATQWFRFKSDCATSWITPYMERINNYTELLNRTFY
ncbi:FAR-RED impaired response 1-like protein [Tanacetum coccineum]